MRGTTLCPHCGTRFKVTKAQLEAHHGMVRCGNCMQAFDTRPNFAPDQLDLQLELPVLEKTIQQPPQKVAVLKPMTLAEQVAIVHDHPDNELQIKKIAWPWAIASTILLLLLLAQAVYFFRVDLAARLPNLKPVLAGYCQMLGCSVPLPQHADLVGIESSDLEVVPAHEDQIILNALLRNRASYTQEFPNLELTLTDSLDQPLARRVFLSNEYLPPLEKQSAGLFPNYEVTIRLPLNTTDLRPMGYRLVLFYPSR